MEYQERCMQFIAEHGQRYSGISATEIRNAVYGRNSCISKAMHELVNEGRLHVFYEGRTKYYALP